MPNRLLQETSPYLRQHGNNPVDWFPWGPEALALSRAQDKPIFLSIGYSACHWCHVMEHECFENSAIAALMNEHFVNVKVDREERPDLDTIYMSAVLMMTGSGGWPMSVFLAPDLRPFFGGTYFPPDDRYMGQGRPGFPAVLRAISSAWKEDRERVLDSADLIVTELRRRSGIKAGTLELPTPLFAPLVRQYGEQYDNQFGGNYGAPKFPAHSQLKALLLAHARTGDEKALSMVSHTLTMMARGGIYDQLGGGFHRYSVDERWLVPHFEKMLYDNAQLVALYAEAYAATGDPYFRRIAGEITDYIAREMTDPAGGFYSTQDADSEGAEGRFFAWTPEQVREVLGAEAELFCRAHGMSSSGNFEHGASVLSLVRPLSELAKQEKSTEDAVRQRLDAARLALFAARETRVKPHRDEKILTSWNGLMIAGLVRAERHGLLDGRALRLARNAADFLLRHARHDGHRLHAVYAEEAAKLSGYLDDYAFLSWGLLELAAETGDPAYFDAAEGLLEAVEAHFLDPDGGYFFTADDHEELLVRTKDPVDNVLPSGNSVLAHCHLLMHQWTGDSRWRDRALRIFETFGHLLERAPTGLPFLLLAADPLVHPVESIVVTGDGPATDALHAAVLRKYTPQRLVVRAPQPTYRPALLAGKTTINGKPAAYRCEGMSCQQPVTGWSDE